MILRRALPLLLLPALLAAGFAHPAHALGPEGANYKRAFSLLDANHPEQAYAAVARGHDPILNKILRAYYMASPGNDIGFDELAAFIAANPDWPGLRGIVMIAEQKIPANMPPAQVAAWFDTHPPITPAGFYRWIDALNVNGQSQDMTRLVRQHWINGDFTADELAAFYARFSQFIDTDSSWARLDRLLWKYDAFNSRRVYPYVDENKRALAEARLALNSGQSNAATFLSQVNGSDRSDAGLLYERFKIAIKNNQDDAAADILQRAPDDLGKPDLWWDQEQILIRRAMQRKDYLNAYRFADAEYGQATSKQAAQGTFMAGWLALRFLNRPDKALTHFQALYDNASTPMTRSRGAYWIGRSYEALGDRNAAEQSYETAAALNVTYYGQLATARLYQNPTIRAMPEPTIPNNIRQRFYARDVVRAVEALHNMRLYDRERSFFHAETEAARERAEYVLLMELAYRIERPDLAIEAAKAANRKNMLMAAGAFPLLSLKIPQPPELAFTHALIRQESMFDADARSPVGAQGLMQLMPGTAAAEAKKLGMKYNAKKINSTDVNLRLGTSFVQHQIESFNGSYVLALAGYNAGPRRVRDWMEIIGDPRDPQIDPIDWVEQIPSAETRNYVQRILENLQIYRARLNGGTAPLLLINDLRR